jgi:hypothetical protein
MVVTRRREPSMVVTHNREPSVVVTRNHAFYFICAARE